MLFKESEKYLGYVLAAQGLEKSVELTIHKRLPKVKGGMNPKLVLEDRATFHIRAIARRKELKLKLMLM